MSGKENELREKWNTINYYWWSIEIICKASA